MTSRSVLLLATNKKEYVNFALNCAESIKLHNLGLPVFIATNIIPNEVYEGIHFIKIDEELAKLNIETKLYADTFLRTEETLFIDSDSICYDSLDPIFNACSKMDVTVIGRPIPLEQYWGITGAGFARSEFGIDKSILFNGGFYYLKKSELTTRIFDKAREISLKYDEYGFARIKNKWKNEEDLLSIAMIANKQHPINDNGEYMTDLVTDRRPVILNVLKGERLLKNPADKFFPKRDHYPLTYSPIILHFGGSNISSYPYVSQSRLLKLNKMGYPVNLSSLIVYAFIDLPYKTYHYLMRIIKKLHFLI